MDIESYGRWHDAICTNSRDLTTEILRELDLHDRKKHLDGYFTSQEQDTDNTTQTLSHCQKSLTLAFVFGSRHTLAAMLEYGADPLISNANGDTILHTVTSVAKCYPETESDLADMYVYLMTLLTPEQQREILFKENALGLRPLEDAAQKGCIILLKTIFNTPGD